MQSVATDVARSVVCVCVSVGTRVSCAKMAESIEMPFTGLTHMGQRIHVLDVGRDPPWERAMFGVVQPNEMHCESLL